MTMYAQAQELIVCNNEAEHQFKNGAKVTVKNIWEGGYLCNGPDKLGKINTWWCEEGDLIKDRRKIKREKN